DKKQFILIHVLQQGVIQNNSFCAHEAGDIGALILAIHAGIDLVNAAALDARAGRFSEDFCLKILVLQRCKFVIKRVTQDRLDPQREAQVKRRQKAQIKPPAPRAFLYDEEWNPSHSQSAYQYDCRALDRSVEPSREAL